MGTFVCGILKRRLFFLLVTVFISSNAFSSTSLSYSGRLVNTNGSPVLGPVNLKAELSYTDAPTTVLCSQDFTNVPLTNGVFNLKLDLNCGSDSISDTLMKVPAGESASIRITDSTHSKAYDFQALYSVPLSNISDVAKQIVQMGASDGQVLKWNNATKMWGPGTDSVGSNGTVTNVSGVLPISVSNGGTTPAISISQASGSSNGYLSSSDWTSFNSKEGSIVGGVATQYYRGDKSWQTLDTSVVPENVKLYFTNARALGVPLTGFVVGANSSIVAADTILGAFEKVQGQIDNLGSASTGYLIKNSNDTITGQVNVDATTGSLKIPTTPSGVDLTDVANVQYVNNYANTKVSKSGDTMTGDLTLNTQLALKGGTNYVMLKANASQSSDIVLTLPMTVGANGQVLTSNGAGVLSWSTPSTSASPSGAAGGDLSGTYPNPSITGLSATKIGNGDVDNTKLSYLNNVTSSIQTQLNAKEGTITAGTTAQYYRGDKTFVTLDTSVVPENGNLYFTNARAIGATITAPTLTNSAIATGDTLQVVAGKLQAQVNSNTTAVATKADQTNATQTITALSVTGLQTPVGSSDAAPKSYVDGFGQWTKSGSDIYRASGKVGIGTTTPQSKLDVNGSVRVGTDATACSGTIAGAMRFNTPNVEFCNGTAWTAIGAASAGGVTSVNSFTGAVNLTTTDVNEGTNLYYTNARGIASTITAPTLTNSAIATGDTLQVVAGKLQAQVNAREGAITAGTAAQYYRGDKTFVTLNTSVVPESGNLYFTNARAIGATITAPTLTNSAIAAGDTLQVVAGKLQAQVNSNITSGATKADQTNVAQTITALSVTGLQTPVASSDAAPKSYVDGFGQWTKSGSDIYRASGNVGIGTTTPYKNLEISASGTSGANGPAISFYEPNGYAGLRRFTLQNNYTPGYNYLTFNVEDDTGGLVSSAMAIASSGNIGIGSTAPHSKLDVNGSIRVGSDATACSGTIAGAMRFNTPNVEFCNGTAWTAIGAASAGGVTSVNSLTGAVNLTTTNVNEGTNLYYTNARGIASTITAPTLTNSAIANGDTLQIVAGKLQAQINNVGSALLSTVLTGLSTATNTAIAATDSILSAFGKLQAQLTSVIASDSAKLTKNSSDTITGAISIAVTGDITTANTPAGLTSLVNKSYADSLVPLAWTEQTTSFTAVAKGRYLVNTSGGAITVTLPASASIGDTIALIDAAGSFGTNNLTVGRNGLLVMGLAQDMTVDKNNISFELVYYNAANGWRIK